MKDFKGNSGKDGGTFWGYFISLEGTSFCQLLTELLQRESRRKEGRLTEL
jgi:hypothetical protein